MGKNDSAASADAYKEAARILLGFETAEEMDALFEHEVVRAAVGRLEHALQVTRAQHRHDEFALALAVETELLSRARTAGLELETMFNDPNHHSPPSDETTKLVMALWAGDRA